MTDAQDTTPESLGPESVAGAPIAPEPIELTVAAWRAELDGQGSVAAADVQDRLLDLWGRLPEGGVRSEIERWLTETLARHLYAAEDIDARLERVLADA